MKAILLVMASVVASLLACSGTSEFPDTDVAELKGFELKRALGVKMSEGRIQTGTLEYSGPGDMNSVYREYVAAMRSMGWNQKASEIEASKATATLEKDTRTCLINFTASQPGQMIAVIKVTETGTKSP